MKTGLTRQEAHPESSGQPVVHLCLEGRVKEEGGPARRSNGQGPPARSCFTALSPVTAELGEVGKLHAGTRRREVVSPVACTIQPCSVGSPNKELGDAAMSQTSGKMVGPLWLQSKGPCM